MRWWNKTSNSICCKRGRPCYLQPTGIVNILVVYAQIPLFFVALHSIILKRFSIYCTALSDIILTISNIITNYGRFCKELLKSVAQFWQRKQYCFCAFDWLLIILLCALWVASYSIESTMNSNRVHYKQTRLSTWSYTPKLYTCRHQPPWLIRNNLL